MKKLINLAFCEKQSEKSAASHCCAFFVFLRPKDVSKSKKLRVVCVSF